MLDHAGTAEFREGECSRFVKCSRLHLDAMSNEVGVDAGNDAQRHEPSISEEKAKRIRGNFDAKR